ncbi:hypothetical protein ACHAWF_011813 [Thalassiosira exigua]
MLSLGGGLQNPDTFPFSSLRFGVKGPEDGEETHLELSREELRAALQYSPTPGFPELVDQLRDLQHREHGEGDYNIMVTVGGQDGQCKAPTAQELLEHWGEDGFDRHARTVADFYCQRRDALLRAAGRHSPDWRSGRRQKRGCSRGSSCRAWTTQMRRSETKAAQANVLFVPGQSFDPLDRALAYVRASFSTASDKEMDAATERLAELIRSEVANGEKQAA